MKQAALLVVHCKYVSLSLQSLVGIGPTLGRSLGRTSAAALEASSVSTGAADKVALKRKGTRQTAENFMISVLRKEN